MLRRVIEAAVPLGVRAVLARALLALPGPVQRRLAGEPVCLDGQRLATEAQLVLRFSGGPQKTVALSRRHMRGVTQLVAGPPVEPVATSELTIPDEAGPIGARLYRPHGLGFAEPSPLLVFFHGGGWVQGDLETHDNVCRFLALHAATAVLAVDYRLAPEHPFPAGVNDSLAAYRYAADHADELGVDPARIAVGGDSAGGNLATVVARMAAGDARPPVFQLLIYPGTDAVEAAASRRLFGEGFLLTEERIQWFLDNYLPDHADRSDPRASPLYEPEPHRLPPTYLVTAGFDPLRDEGERFGARLAEAGVPVVVRRFPDLYHGFANAIGIGRRSREAMHEIAGALRVGLALAPAIPRTAPSTEHPTPDAAGLLG